MVQREAATGLLTGSHCGLGPQRALVSLCLGVLQGLCVGGGGPPSAGDTWRAGSQARQQGRPSTAQGGQGRAAAGGCLGLSGASVSPSAAGRGLGVGCPGWGHPKPGSLWRRDFALRSQPVGLLGSVVGPGSVGSPRRGPDGVKRLPAPPPLQSVIKTPSPACVPALLGPPGPLSHFLRV